MGVTLKFANLWRIIRDVDLDEIRRQAKAPFRLVILDDGVLEEGGGPAARLRDLFSAPHGPHPAIELHGFDAIWTPGGASVTNLAPHAALVVTSTPHHSSPLTTAVTRLRQARIPIVLVVTGDADRRDDRSLDVDEAVSVAALDASAVRPIGAALMKAVPPDTRLALARQLPALRPSMFDVTIEETARANASYALTTGLAEVVPLLTVPLNLGDMIVLTKNQLIMAYRLALAAGRDGEPRQLIGELLGVLGGGLLFRQLARQLVGMIPVIGLVPKIAVAYGGTWAIGRAVTVWLTEGREVTSELVQSMAAEGLERGRGVATAMVAQAKSTGLAARSRWDRLRNHLPLRRSRR